MWTLLIETSTDRPIVALFQDEVCRYFSCLPMGYESSRYLVPKIDEGFKELHMTADCLDLIAVGIGPGSYTGTRVGVVVAKSMAYATGKPLIGINSLSGFISDGPFAAIVDAKLSGAIIQKGNLRLLEGSPELIAWDKVEPFLEGISVLVTPNATRIRHLLKEGVFEWIETAPDPFQMVKIALSKYAAGDFGDVTISYLKPLY